MTEGGEVQGWPPEGRLMALAAPAALVPTEAGSLKFKVSVRLVMDSFGAALEVPTGDPT